MYFVHKTLANLPLQSWRLRKPRSQLLGRDCSPYLPPRVVKIKTPWGQGSKVLVSGPPERNFGACGRTG